MDRYCKSPWGFDLVGVSNGLGEKLFGQPAPVADTEKGFYCAVTVPLLCQKGAIQKTRLISIDTTGPKVEPLETTRKQAFGGVFPRKQAMPAAGIEPATDGLENRYLDSIKPIGGMGLGTGGKPAYPSVDPTNPWDLQEVIEAWDLLPDAIKAGILAMVAASKPVEPPPLGAVLSNRLNTWQRKTGANPKRIRR